jgi:hypothetical protein
MASKDMLLPREHAKPTFRGVAIQHVLPHACKPPRLLLLLLLLLPLLPLLLLRHRPPLHHARC